MELTEIEMDAHAVPARAAQDEAPLPMRALIEGASVNAADHEPGP